MKKFIISLMTLSLFACTNSIPANNTQVSDSVQVNKLSVSAVEKAQSNSEVKLSFSIKNVVSSAELRVKSVDVYLVNVTGLTDPTNPANQVVAMKQVDVVNGVVSTSFTLPVPVVFTGPYYAVVQAFDNTIAGVPRNNITALNPSALNLPVAFSSNTANYSNGSVVYSTGTSLTMTINLAPYNNANADVTLQNGSQTPTNPITVTEQQVL